MEGHEEKCCVRQEKRGCDKSKVTIASECVNVCECLCVVCVCLCVINHINLFFYIDRNKDTTRSHLS